MASITTKQVENFLKKIQFDFYPFLRCRVDYFYNDTRHPSPKLVEEGIQKDIMAIQRVRDILSQYPYSWGVDSL